MRLGNLSIKQIEERAGVTFPAEFVKEFESKRQENISYPIAKASWHCFDLPFELVIGEELIDLVKKYLVPLGKDFKKPLQVSIQN